MDWKASPADPAKKWLNRSLEIQINLFCNWSCHACDQLSQFPQIQFIKQGTMSIGQIEHFCREMKSTNSYVGRIRLVGGEPSLHRDLKDILELLDSELICDYDPSQSYVGRLEMVTNGSHPEKIAKARGEGNEKLPLRIRVSDENDKQKHHTANLIHTPASLGYEGKMCSAPWHCGMSLNHYGWFPCSSGAGIARLMDDMTQWQRLSIPVGDSAPYDSRKVQTVMRTWPNLQQLCNQCYHGLKDEHKQKCGTGQLPGQESLNKPSDEMAVHLSPWLAGKQPDWPVYGAPPAADMLPGRPAAALA